MTEPIRARWTWVSWRPFGHAASLRDYGVTFVAEFATLAGSRFTRWLARRNPSDR